MIVLSYGYRLPEDGDIGDEIFDALESNIQQVNDHIHDGITSAKLSSANIVKLTQPILAAGWVAQGNGLFRQLVTITGGLSIYDDVYINCRDTDTGDQLELSIEKVSDSTFYVYNNDATQNVTILYV